MAVAFEGLERRGEERRGGRLKGGTTTYHKGGNLVQAIKENQKLGEVPE